MRSFAIASAILALLICAAPSEAQNQLPTTVVSSPKRKPKIAVVTRPPPRRGALDSAGVPVHPDPNSGVRGRDWNAPGVLNLGYMTDAQFAAFQAAHPTATFWGRCFMGQDPDPAIRFNMKRIQIGLAC